MLAALALVGAACGGGGESAGPVDDPLDQEPGTGGERRIQFTGAGDVRLEGTFTSPGTGKAPAVLFVPDVLVTDRDGTAGAGTAFDRMADELAGTLNRAGLATFRYDRRGTGQSPLEADQRLSFDDLVADARAGLDFLAQRTETAGSKLAVVGYDESALVALRLAATDDRVDRLVLISPPGRSLVEVQAEEFAALYGPESGTALRETVAGVVAGGDVPALQDMPAELRPLLPQGEGAFLAQLYQVDPTAEAARLDIPVLLVVGSRAMGEDRADAERLAQAVGAGAEVVVADNADATLLTVVTPKDDPSDVNSPVHDHGAAPPAQRGGRDEAAVERLTAWLRAGLATAG